MLCDEDVTWLASQRRVDRTRWAVKRFLMLGGGLESGESLFPLLTLWEARPEPTRTSMTGIPHFAQIADPRRPLTGGFA
jgi:hypothetical protein